MKKLIAAILSIAAIALPQSSIAQTAPFNSPHKWTDTATNKTYVFIPNQIPLVPVPGLISLDESGDQSMQSNDCGWGSIDYFVTLINVQRYNQPGFIDWQGKTTGAVPTCTQNTTGAWVSSNNAAVGTVIKAGSKYWIKAGNSYASIVLTLSYGKAVKNKANACGFLRVLTSDTRSMNNFIVGTTNYSLAGISAVAAPMICRKTGAASAIYTPLNP